MPITAWTQQDLTEIDRHDEVRLQPRRADGSLAKPRTVWAVRLDESIYVRSVNGAEGAWYRMASASREGHLRVGAVDLDVSFVEVDHDNVIEDQIDAAYQAKYGKYTGPVERITSERSRRTTLEVIPR